MAIDANAGARVGDYFLARKLGEGGMAEVWLARHHATAQLRALKFLNSQYQGIPEVEARFQNEGESQLIHPNIVRIYEVGQEGGSSYIAMDFIDGHDLENILNSRRGPLTVPESLDIGTQILAGLGFAHAAGIVHRDIKPSNVLVDRDGHAYVMDFGIAKVLRAGRMLTQVNSRLGTPDYMSPEQIRNPRDVDTRSDIYSFGCLFYELLTGWPPFDRGEGYETEHDIKTAHVTQPPTPPMVRKTGLPAQLNEITLKCLAKAKEDRPQTCDDVIAALNAYRVSALQATKSVRASTIIEPPPKFNSGAGVSDGSTPRRETAVIPPANHGNVGVNHGRIPTSVDPPPPPPQFKRAEQAPPRMSPQIPPQVPFQTPQQSSQHTPQQAPYVPPFRPPQSSFQGRPQKSGSGGFVPLFLITAVSLFLLILLSTGGWNWYQKHRNDDTQATRSTPNSDQTPNTQTASNSGAADTSSHPSGTQQPLIVPNVQPQPTTPITPIPTPATPTTPPNTHPKVLQQDIDSLFKDKPTAPRTPAKTPSTSPAFGTLIWTGDATVTGRHVTIIRSSKSALEGGSIAGTMFPAGPIRVHVRAPATATVVLPDARTNYNSLQLFLPATGRQTIYLDWTAIPN